MNLPLIPTRCLSGHVSDDRQGRVLRLLAGHHKGHHPTESHLFGVQSHGTLPTRPTAYPTLTIRIPLPVCVLRPLPLQRPPIPRVSGPLQQLAGRRTLRPGIQRTGGRPLSDIRYIRNPGRTGIRWWAGVHSTRYPTLPGRLASTSQAQLCRLPTWQLSCRDRR